MITKILLTILVIVGAYALIKRQRINANKPTDKPSPENDPSKVSFDASDLRTGAYMFIAIMFMLGGYFYYERWQEDHQLLTIRLYNAESQHPVEYQVFRSQLNNRSFVTTDGIQVKVSDNERMEVIGLNPK